MPKPKKETPQQPKEEEFVFDDDLTNEFCIENKKPTIEQPIKLNDPEIKVNDIIVFSTFYTTQFGFEIIDTRNDKHYYTNKQITKFINELLNKSKLYKKSDSVSNQYFMNKRIYLKMIQRVENEDFKYNTFEVKILKN